MKAVIIVNDAPYGTECSYNGLRLAHALRKNDPTGHVVVFLMGDAVACAKAGQKPPEGFYNTEKMVRRVIDSGNDVLLCGTCILVGKWRPTRSMSLPGTRVTLLPSKKRPHRTVPSAQGAARARYA